MPAHSSHLLQPLDVGCFSPLKRAYGRLIEAKARLGFYSIDKLDFLRTYPQAREEVFSIQNIQSGFRATGILPFNPQEVLDRFNYSVEALDEETPPSSRGKSSTSSSTLGTPRTIRQLHKKASSVKKRLYTSPRAPSTPSKRLLDELIKGCELAIYNTAFTMKELTDLRAESLVQGEKKTRSKRQMTPNEGLQVSEARDLIMLRNELLDKQGSGPGSSTTGALGDLNRPKRAPPTCSECNVQGHIRTRCPNRR
jgi:hypothetical protein